MLHRMRFSTTVLLGGRTATGLVVPPEIVEALGAGKKPAVTVTVGGHTYRSTVAPRGGQFMIPLSAENRAAAGVAAGLAATLALAIQTDALGVPWLAYCLFWLAGSLSTGRRETWPD